jgi:hypothetical protein
LLDFIRVTLYNQLRAKPSTDHSCWAWLGFAGLSTNQD